MTDINALEHQPIAWTPTPDVIERAQLTKFMRQVGVETWDELYKFSIRDVEKFTEEILKFLDIKFDPPYEKLLDTTDGIEFPKWFLRSEQRSEDTPVLMSPSSGEDQAVQSSDLEDRSVLAPTAGLNITTMCLDRWQTDKMKDQPALIWEGESGDIRKYSYGQLMDNLVACTNRLIALGLKKGDSVGIHLPMLPETVVALLAVNRIGAIAVPVFSGYGPEAITNRMKAVEAKAFITCFETRRRGKKVDMLSVAARAIASVPSIKTVLLVGGRTVSKVGLEGLVKETERLKHEVFGGRTVAHFKVNGDLFDLLDDNPPAKTSAEDPLIILYTSGTTGKPKGIAHTHASFPIKAAQDMALGTDVGRGTRICWYTDIGWMMGPWLIYGALINGATICIYDGAPDYPTPDRMWEFCAKHKVEVLGISPTLVRALAAHEQRSEDTPVLTDSASASGHQIPDRRGWSRHGKLPHFDGEIVQFVTFRLADSIPQGLIEKLKLELERERSPDVAERLRQRIEEYLDKGGGECIFNHAAVADAVREAILYEDGKSCDLKAWVIMPNHAHLLIRMREGFDLASLMKRVKGVSARKINKLLGRSGTIWQADYFDRYIRDAQHYTNVFQYIENNPVVAGLAASPGEWKFGSASSRSEHGGSEDTSRRSEDTSRRSEDTPVLMSPPSGEDQAAQSSDLEDTSVLAPFQRHDLRALRAFASTGEPWNPAPWWWLFKEVGNSKLPIINYSGGTEISGGILMGNPLLPQKSCSFPAPCPGMDVDILNEDGDPVEAGKVGELVIKQPWIGMARGFWQEKERYLDTYWRRFKDIWVHGDWAMRDEDGHWFILGRSDDTLKVAGKRVGPAEVESILVSHPAVTEAAIIGIPDETKGTAMVAFVVLGPQNSSPAQAETRPLGSVSDRTDLEADLKSLVARDMGKPLAPSKVHFVSALPKTRNAKVMRRVIRSAYLGEDPGDLSALEDPKSVEEIRSAGIN